jgi:tRNA G18 (ribose-2'-O)-methylase SpoU
VPSPELNLIPLDTLDDPRTAEYRALRDAHLRDAAADPAEPSHGVFIAEGELVVRQLFSSSLRTRSVLLTHQRLSTMRDALEHLPSGTPIYLTGQAVMNGIVGFNIHRGILASGDRPPQPDLGVLLRTCASLVILEDLANHDNVGGIFRCTAALAGIPSPGVAGPTGAAVLLSPRCCDPLYRKAIRVSVGAALHIPFARLSSWPDQLHTVRDAGFRLIALTPDPAAIPIDQVGLSAGSRSALILGAEGPGLTDAALTLADVRVRIPISFEVDSLNVTVAAAIALHRLCRPRGEPGDRSVRPTTI